MHANVIYVGIDVDDVRYHGAALNRHTGEVLEFNCRPTLQGLAGLLDKLHRYFGGSQLQLCYEASYVGFSLQRDLHNKGYRRGISPGCRVVEDTQFTRPTRQCTRLAPIALLGMNKEFVAKPIWTKH